MKPKVIVKRLQNQNILPEDKSIGVRIAQDFCHLFQIVRLKTGYPLIKDLRPHIRARSR